MISKTESLIKSVVYRLFGTLATFVIAFAFTQHALLSSGIAIVELVTKTAMYYVYERFWNKISWRWKARQSL